MRKNTRKKNTTSEEYFKTLNHIIAITMSIILVTSLIIIINSNIFYAYENIELRNDLKQMTNRYKLDVKDLQFEEPINNNELTRNILPLEIEEESNVEKEYIAINDKSLRGITDDKKGDTEHKIAKLKNDFHEHVSIKRLKRATREIQRDITLENSTEVCIGAPEFCNLSRTEYITMLNEYIYPQTYEWVLIATHTAVFIIGLVGNSLVCVAVYRNHSMRTVTNYFLVNLAVADFMVILFCLPATVLWDVTETWFLGDALCKILLYFQSVSVTVSVLTLTFISVDRWYAICFPLKFKSTITRAKTAILLIWTISLIFNAPELVVLTTVKLVPLRFELEYLVQCTATWSYTSDLMWHITKVVFIYTIPLLLMTVAYHQIVRVLWRSEKIPGQAETVKLASAEQTQLRSRRKAAKMLVAVVIMFAVCYFPVHLLSVLRYMPDIQQNDLLTCLALLSHVLCYANSAINPLIYNFMSGKYRREFKRGFCCSSSLSIETQTTTSRLTSKRQDMRCQHICHQRQYRNMCHICLVRNNSRNSFMN